LRIHSRGAPSIATHEDALRFVEHDDLRIELLDMVEIAEELLVTEDEKTSVQITVLARSVRST